MKGSPRSTSLLIVDAGRKSSATHVYSASSIPDDPSEIKSRATILPFDVLLTNHAGDLWRSTMECSKCHANAVHVIQIPWPGRTIGASIPVGVFSSAKIDHHVCTHCGFVEMYLSDRDELAKIAGKWPLVDQSE